jgi:hypothetical protein
MRDCLSVHMPVSKLEGRNCGVPNQWWVNSLYVGIFPFTFYGQLWAQCLVYIMGVGGIWNTGITCVVMHSSERKFSFLRNFLLFFLVWQPPFDLNLTTLYHIPHNFLMYSLWNISLNNAAQGAPERHSKKRACYYLFDEFQPSYSWYIWFLSGQFMWVPHFLVWWLFPFPI